VQNFVQIGSGVFPDIGENNITPQVQTLYFVFCSSSHLQPRPDTDLHTKYVKRCDSTQGCAFCGFRK